MLYMIVKIIEQKGHKIMIENNQIGYLGYFIGTKDFVNLEQVQLYLIRVRNDYVDEYISSQI
ncbi:hypothetical protein SCLARK_001015 [Spiroplasma clarkii]|uniref:hypothetical protein n=1 Tax=Spiroplasma clarkii TaxID=2139 RepID=UPI000B576B59|nr:hypothetical protein [Spiroplasma clarkii]ARU91606.1 hypothetical protein SCLARK_001015 [Spiroplasma clarkii]